MFTLCADIATEIHAGCRRKVASYPYSRLRVIIRTPGDIHAIFRKVSFFSKTYLSNTFFNNVQYINFQTVLIISINNKSETFNTKEFIKNRLEQTLNQKSCYMQFKSRRNGRCFRKTQIPCNSRYCSRRIAPCSKTVYMQSTNQDIAATSMSEIFSNGT